MENKIPWYLLPPTEEECRQHAADPWANVPEHLRPRFLESEIEYRMRIATMAMQSGAEPVKTKELPSWKVSQIRKFLQKTEAPAVEIKSIKKPDYDTLALVSEWELMKRETEWRDRKKENMELTKAEAQEKENCPEE